MMVVLRTFHWYIESEMSAEETLTRRRGEKGEREREREREIEVFM
jgi:hypothetical protein